MTPAELCAKLGGETTTNRMVAFINGKREVIARMKGDEYQLEPIAAALVAELNAKIGVGAADDSKPAPKKVKRAPRKAAKVEADLPED
jgi:hypothetical protein